MDTEIENRSGEEVSHVEGWNALAGMPARVRIIPEGSPVSNPGFDITPARLVSGLITERGICAATETGITSLFGE